ncbi:MAG: universal stress protein [Solirubrobacteraceae bacterium]|jgi:nucleotide-binding universal stress UspA family protein
MSQQQPEQPSPAPGRLDGSCLILGYDRTDSARHAADWAARQLQPNGKLVIVHACRPLHAPPSVLSSHEERRELGRALIDELLLEDSGPLLDIEVEADVSDSDPVTALIDAARRHEAGAIVIGHEQRSPLRRVLGTVTTELLDTSPVPVVSVPLSGV